MLFNVYTLHEMKKLTNWRDNIRRVVLISDISLDCETINKVLSGEGLVD